MKDPEFQDKVKNIKNDATGVVIAKYKTNGIYFLDVRDGYERIWYNTPMANWTVVKACDE